MHDVGYHQPQLLESGSYLVNPGSPISFGPSTVAVVCGENDCRDGQFTRLENLEGYRRSMVHQCWPIERQAIQFQAGRVVQRQHDPDPGFRKIYHRDAGWSFYNRKAKLPESQFGLEETQICDKRQNPTIDVGQHATEFFGIGAVHCRQRRGRGHCVDIHRPGPFAPGRSKAGSANRAGTRSPKLDQY
jgi:hypothetical protein